MTDHLTRSARCRCRWTAVVRDLPSGELELYETSGGFFWFWRNKPAHLVPLCGVLDDQTPAATDPHWFFEAEAAQHHIMHCTGIAFLNRCGLTLCADSRS